LSEHILSQLTCFKNKKKVKLPGNSKYDPGRSQVRLMGRAQLRR